MRLRVAVTLTLVAAAAVVLAAHWPTVSSGLKVARGASIGWLVLSLLLMALTFALAAAIYGVLALRPLRYRQTLLVEVGTAFVNRLLPSGIGGLGLHGVYLYRRKHTAAEATVVVSMNNLLGITAHLLLLAALVVWRPGIVQQLFSGHHIGVSWQVLTIVSVCVLGLGSVPKVRRKLIRFGHNVLRSFHRLRLASVCKALGLAAMLTATYTLILLSSVRSIGLPLDVLQVFVVFSIGMLFSTATPTPGGLVGAEAGLFAGLVAYDVPAAQAAAVVLLYRLATYWLPMVPGVVALLVARRHKLV